MQEKDYNQIFSTRLKYYMDKYNLNQAELAKRLGVGPTSVYNWCNGIKSPRMDKVDKMCEIFNCRRTDLMSECSDTSLLLSKALSSDEENLLTQYRSLNDDGKEKLIERADELRTLGYIKEDMEKMA